ncbi:hypothetical protein CIB93_13945 [Streptomyces sp. WZ.A104]|nr:hypothetical protein CIB93_13945 [Streptomyces sp. WZ.A104]
MIDTMLEGEHKVLDVPLTKKRYRRLRAWTAAGAVALAAVGAALWAWEPWKDRTPFTAYRVGVQVEEHTKPGSQPGTCERTAASGEETVIYSKDGTRLAAGRAPVEGERLGPEFGDFAGACLFVTRIDGIPGGEGTYVTDWGGGSRSEIGEEDLRESAAAQRERFKAAKKSDFHEAR